MRPKKSALSVENKSLGHFPLSKISTVLQFTLGACALYSFGNTAYAREIFNPAFLANDPSVIADLKRFENGEGQSPGNYSVDVYLNESFVLSKDLVFTKSGKATAAPTANRVDAEDGESEQVVHSEIRHDDSGLTACIPLSLLERLGLNRQAVPDLKGTISDTECINIEERIPNAQSVFDFDSMRLFISLPQLVLNNNAKGYIPPEEWDDGVTALLLNYTFNGSNQMGVETFDSKENRHNYFLGLNSSVNIGPWRIRNNSSWNYQAASSDKKSEWQNISTYAQRTIVPLSAQLTLGDTYSGSEVFNGVGVRGASIASDENMLPDSMRGFAPTVRGIARTNNARVSIRQNGFLIYQTYVSPGAFEISDLLPNSSSGDLEVTVTEADGGQSQYTVPYSAVPLLQREGRTKYEATVGRYRSASSDQSSPYFAQLTAARGLSKGVTAYGGVQYASNYRALALGVGVNMGGYGALSVDVTNANSVLPDNSKRQGQSIRFLYAKSLNQTGTTFQLLGYRFSTQGFYTLSDTTYKKMVGYADQADLSSRSYYNLNYNRKGNWQANISQKIGETGSLFVSGGYQSYWNTKDVQNTWKTGYTGLYKGVTYGVSYAHNSQPGEDKSEQILSVNLSFPLGKLSSSTRRKNKVVDDVLQSSYATYSLTTEKGGGSNHQLGLAGTLLDRQNLSYSFQQGYAQRGSGNNGSLNLSYRGTYNNTNLSYSYGSRGLRQVNYGVSGGVVVHADGVTFSQPLGDTNILVKAPKADHVSIENMTGVRTDWRGYAVIPYATSYRKNRVALDIKTLDDDVELESTVAEVVPTSGALVKAEFTTRVGSRALFYIKRSNGSSVPFGAQVELNDEKKISAVVGDNGQMYLSGLPQKGTLMVSWGQTQAQQCKVDYDLGHANKQSMAIINSECQ